MFFRKVLYVFITAVFISCAKELVDYSESEVKITIPLTIIEEFSQDGSTHKRFGNVRYNENGLVNFAYVDFAGYEANQSYIYDAQNIKVEMFCKDNIIITRHYTLIDGKIQVCDSYENQDGVLIQTNEILYTYDNKDRLIKINILNIYKDKNGNDKSNQIVCDLSWDDRNITDILSYITENEVERCSIKYKREKTYKNKFPLTHLPCIYYGSVGGIDEILMAQGYFGNSIPFDLPKEVYSFENLSRTFQYDLDSSGNIGEIRQVDKSNKTIRKYIYDWSN